MEEAIRTSVNYTPVKTLPQFFNDPYTVYNTPEEEERLKALLPRSHDETWNCPLCNTHMEIAGQMDIDSHLAECQKSSVENMRKEMKTEMQELMSTLLVASRPDPNQELLTELKKLREENESLKKKKKGK